MSDAPNILWLNTDHQLFANRPDLARRLPLQGALARRGMVFERAYTALPACSPARASMLTGLYPHNHGLTENDGRFGGRAGLDGTDALFTATLARAGYSLGWFGKWHLSNTLGAEHFGFQGYGPAGYGYPYETPEYQAYLDRAGLPVPMARVELSGESGTRSGTGIDLQGQTDWFDYEAGTAVLDGPAETHEAYFVADLAKRWLADLGDAPFFARVDTWGPHPPYVVGGAFAQMFGDLETAASANLENDLSGRPGHHAAYRDYWAETLDETARDYALLSRRALQQAALCETALLGVVSELDRLGRLENTIVIFSADHGDAVASNGGVLNKGGLMVEETLRIPLVMAGPGVTAGRNDGLVCNIDLAPTILDLCGLTPGGMDGQSLRPLLEGTGALDRVGLMTQHYGLAQPLWQRAFHVENWKYVIQQDGFAELYDLGTDPGETTNLAGDPARVRVRQRMQAGLAKALEASGDRSPGALRFLGRSN